MPYRQGRNYENLNKVIFDGAGAFDTPRILHTEVTADSFIGFNFARSCKHPENTGVHFFIDDYQFTRLWSHPDPYLELLRKFRCVCAPDFSIYTDFPRAVQIYNHYRKHWLGAYWQMHGITVIPTISWSDAASFEWCFDGEPEGGVVAVSSVGTQKNSYTKKLFLEGYAEMLKRLEPAAVIFYGAVPEESADKKIIPVEAFQAGMKVRCKTRKDLL